MEEPGLFTTFVGHLHILRHIFQKRHTGMDALIQKGEGKVSPPHIFQLQVRLGSNSRGGL